MIEAFIIFLAWSNLFGFSESFDPDKTIPICENKTLHDVYLDLSKMELQRIRKSFVSGRLVTCINLEANNIRGLEKGAFDNLPELKYLNLAGNAISFEDFMNMAIPNLKALVLDENNGYDGRYRSSTSGYYTRYNDDSYGNEDFQRHGISDIFLPKLEKLSMRNYRDENMVSTRLAHFNAPNLTHLYIAGNRLQYPNLPEKFIQTITHLNLDDNELSIFVTGFPRLRYLSMDSNRISSICNANCHGSSLSLQGIPDLEYLSIMQNSIGTIDSDAFEDLENLQVLNLATNMIRYLPEQLFNNMTNLKNLSLAGNSLTEIPNISELRGLEILNLNGNKITHLGPTSFCNLRRLNFIDLSHNNLTGILDGTFAELPGLTVLNLSWNGIDALPENWIGSETILKVLNLDGNMFDDIFDMSLGLVKNLEILSFGHNPMGNVTVGSLITLPPSIKIDVSRVCESTT